MKDNAWISHMALTDSARAGAVLTGQACADRYQVRMGEVLLWLHRAHLAAVLWGEPDTACGLCDSLLHPRGVHICWSCSDPVPEWGYPIRFNLDGRILCDPCARKQLPDEFDEFDTAP